MAEIQVQVQNHLMIITINRPEVRNCINGSAAELLKKAWLSFRDDPDLWVAILTATGDKAFCSGADLGALDTLGPGPDASPSKLRQFIHSGHGFLGYTRQTDIDKPIIAAVNGDALAGGLELACMADIRIAEPQARFAVACRRWGVPLVDGGTQRLPRIVGMGRAMELILTGRFIDVEEAYRIGLVTTIADKGQALQDAIALGEQLCSVPQAAMRADKRAAQMGYGRPLEEGLRIEASLGVSVLQDPDMREGAHAFKAKRKPDYRNND